jgi:hypothetical protein
MMAMADLMEEESSVWHMEVISPQELAHYMTAGDHHATQRAAAAVTMALDQLSDNPDENQCFLCLSDFGGDAPHAVILVTANVDYPQGMVITGLCEKCYRSDNLAAQIRAEFSHLMAIKVTPHRQ